MVAETASIVGGGRQKHSNRLITHYNKYPYALVLVLVDHTMAFSYGYCAHAAPALSAQLGCCLQHVLYVA